MGSRGIVRCMRADRARPSGILADPLEFPDFLDSTLTRCGPGDPAGASTRAGGSGVPRRQPSVRGDSRAHSAGDKGPGGMVPPPRHVKRIAAQPGSGGRACERAYWIPYCRKRR